MKETEQACESTTAAGMELQTESSEPVATQAPPPGRINKAAFKLFGRRKPGSAVPAIFSIRGAGGDGGKGAALVRSQTHDGLEEPGVSMDQEPGATLPTRRPLAKSLSFFSLLRRNGRGAEPAGQSRPPRHKRGLRGLLGSMRWPRRDKHRDREPERGGHAEEDVVLSLEPQDTATGNSSSTEAPADSGSRSGLDGQDGASQCSAVMLVSACEAQTHLLSCTAPIMTVTPPPERHAADPAPEPSVDRLCSIFTDVTSLKSFDSLTGCGDIIAEPEEDSGGNGSSGSSSGTGSSSGAGAEGTEGRSRPGVTADVLPSPVRTRSPRPAAAPDRPLSSAPACTTGPVTDTGPQKPPGSGVVAYMGGGEEMASPEAVDDADMQVLWHMLPPQDEDVAAASPQQRGRARGKPSHEATLDEVRGKGPGVEPLPISDEGYWDSPTPGPEDEGAESAGSPLLREALPRDSCSGDALYDLYMDPEGVPSLVASDEEASSLSLCSSNTGTPSQAVPQASFRSLKGSASLPRDSRIPVSIRQAVPCHSSSQGALVAPPTPAPAVKEEPPRTKIPVSKVPVRRSSNKPASGARPPDQRK